MAHTLCSFILARPANTQIGAVPTPWPSWHVAAHPERASTTDLTTFLSTLTQHVQEFQKPESRAGPSVEFIKETFGYPEEDVKVCVFISFMGVRSNEMT